jgi:hypothetical protein
MFLTQQAAGNFTRTLLNHRSQITNPKAEREEHYKSTRIPKCLYLGYVIWDL